MIDIPTRTRGRWQYFLNTLAEVIDVPAALIMYHEQDYMEVYLSSESRGNPYSAGDKEKWYGLYCQTVIQTRKELLVPNSQEDPDWKDNPDVELGMISYLGYPISLEDGSVFGTICVLDSKTNAYNESEKRLIRHFRDVIQSELDVRHKLKRSEESFFEKMQKADAKLEESELTMRAVLSSFQDAYFRLNLEGELLLINDAAVGMFGFTDSDIRNKKKEPHFFFEQLQHQKLIQLLEEKNRITDFVCLCKRKDNTQFWGSINLQFVSDRYGSKVGIEGVIRDVTERMEYQNKIEAAHARAEQSNQLKTAFLNNISHEIRTPLNGILGFSGLLVLEDITKEQRKLYSEIIEENGRNLTQIIDDLMLISELETGQVELVEKETDLGEILSGLAKNYRLKAANKEIDFITNFPKEELLALIDGARIRRVLDSLLSNALKFTAKGHVEFSCEMTDTSILFRIKDTGIGIDKDLLSEITKVFRQGEVTATRNYQGAGIGLSLCSGLLNCMGGTLEIKTEPGKGSEFKVSIPNKMKINYIQEEIKSDSAFLLAGRRILIVEDEVYNYYYIAELLKRMGASILHAENGKVAVSMVEQNNDIDMVLMDIKMPIMNGYDATEKIKSINPNLPVIAVTAHAFPGDKEKALNAGCNDYISKPIKEDLLKFSLQKFMN